MTEEQYLQSKSRFKKLSAKEIHKIFGPGLDDKRGNQLLNTVQKQRVTGTLDLPVSGPGITKGTISIALAWLRRAYPLDEDAAIVARLEREEEVVQGWSPQQNANPDNLYGEGVFERVRAKNIAEQKRAEEEEKARKEAEDAGQNVGPLTTRQKAKELAKFKEAERSRESHAWREKYREAATISKGDPVEPSTAKWLIPTTLFMTCAIALCAAFAMEYQPPAKNGRLFPDIPPAAATVGAIIALNLLFWGAWHFPPMWRFMNLNMLMIPVTPNPVALLGNIFSHQDFKHLAVNMVGIWFIGTALHDEVGRGRFLAIFIGTGIFASWTSMVRVALTKNWQLTSLGASGALMGMVGAFCTLYPDKLITSYLLPEEWQKWFCIRADWIFWGLLGLELSNIYRRKIINDHVAHVGGLLSGMVAAEAIRRHARLKQVRPVQHRPTIVR